MKHICRYTSEQIRRAGMTVITAHSGCEGTPANSIEHIYTAIESGAEMIEIDVRSDGDRLYLYHDPHDDPSTCVSFDTFMSILSNVPAMRVNCDVKEEGLVAPVMAIARKYGQEWRILFTGSCNEDGVEANKLGADLWIGIWGGDPETVMQEHAEKYAYLDDLVINTYYGLITDENAAYLREHGVGLSGWTISNEADLRRFLKLGLTNITTRTPKLAMALRDEIQGTPASRGLIPEACIESIIRAAGALMRKVPDEVRNNPDAKEGSSNFVTAYDVKIQNFLKESLSELIPEACFFAEEDGESRRAIGEGYTFIIDPIDGTTNFMCGYNTSAVSVGLLRDGEPVFGAIYDPYRDEYFSAVRGQGATCNGAPIHVSKRPASRGLVAVGTAPYHKDTLADTVFAMTGDLFRLFADVRRSGSAALDICHVACGRTEAFCEPLLSPWDFAAGLLILTEAGGKASDFKGEALKLEAPTACVFGSPSGHGVALEVCRPYASATENL